jgi:hypothetical protein
MVMARHPQYEPPLRRLVAGTVLLACGVAMWRLAHKLSTAALAVMCRGALLHLPAERPGTADPPD